MAKKIIIVLLVLIIIGVIFLIIHFGIGGKEISVTDKPEENVLLAPEASKMTGESLFFRTNKDVKSGNDKILGYFEKEGIAKQEEPVRLKSVIVDNAETGKYMFQYAYVSEKELFMVNYDPNGEDVQMAAQRAISPAEVQSMFFLEPDYPEVPNYFLEEGLEKPISLLEKNDEYRNYREKFPDLFEKFVAMAIYEKSSGWEWRFSFFDDKTDKSMEFVINPEQDTVRISVVKANVN